MSAISRNMPKGPRRPSRRLRYEVDVSRTAQLLTFAWLCGLAAWVFAAIDPSTSGHAAAFAGGMFIASGAIPLVLLKEVPRHQLTRSLLFESTYRTCVPLGFGPFLVLLLPDMPPALQVISVVLLALGAAVVATSFPPLLLRRVRRDASPKTRIFG